MQEFHFFTFWKKYFPGFFCPYGGDTGEVTTVFYLREICTSPPFPPPPPPPCDSDKTHRGKGEGGQSSDLGVREKTAGVKNNFKFFICLFFPL